MQWTARGAHLLMQVRAKVMNDELADEFNTLYPNSSRSMGQTMIGKIQQILQLSPQFFMLPWSSTRFSESVNLRYMVNGVSCSRGKLQIAPWLNRPFPKI